MEALGLVLLYVVEPVGHSAAELEINGALAEPTPALEGSGRNIPALCELILIEMLN
jgi:hypothetical protein